MIIHAQSNQGLKKWCLGHRQGKSGTHQRRVSWFLVDMPDMMHRGFPSTHSLNLTFGPRTDDFLDDGHCLSGRLEPRGLAAFSKPL